VERAWTAEARRAWGLRLVSVDQCTLALPESPALYRAFGCHRGDHGLTAITVEFACVFGVTSRVPLGYVCGRTYTAEEPLLSRLRPHLRRGDLALLDAGFFGLPTFRRLLGWGVQFLCPQPRSGRPAVLRQLGPRDYLCRLQRRDPATGQRLELVVRVVYVSFPGFRRRRLVTSLLDPARYPAGALAALYHQRWQIETFYRDFKSTMRANVWHCRTPANFQRELLAKLALVCLLRQTMTAAARRRHTTVGKLSFSAAWAGLRAFCAGLLRAAGAAGKAAYARFVAGCAAAWVRSPPGRRFSRDHQTYRRIARGLCRRKPGRPPKPRRYPHPPQPEVFTPACGYPYLLN